MKGIPTARGCGRPAGRLAGLQGRQRQGKTGQVEGKPSLALKSAYDTHRHAFTLVRSQTCLNSFSLSPFPPSKFPLPRPPRHHPAGQPASTTTFTTTAITSTSMYRHQYRHTLPLFSFSLLLFSHPPSRPFSRSRGSLLAPHSRTGTEISAESPRPRSSLQSSVARRAVRAVWPLFPVRALSPPLLPSLYRVSTNPPPSVPRGVSPSFSLFFSSLLVLAPAAALRPGVNEPTK